MTDFFLILSHGKSYIVHAEVLADAVITANRFQERLWLCLDEAGNYTCVSQSVPPPEGMLFPVGLSGVEESDDVRIVGEFEGYEQAVAIQRIMQHLSH